tara:strand:- start:383 stop:532 length:150 start_codon:yes stop_codon:yes gene_type:complete
MKNANAIALTKLKVSAITRVNVKTANTVKSMKIAQNATKLKSVQNALKV